MSLQWTLVATFLYAEVGLMCILLLPFISPTLWQKILRSRFVVALGTYASIYFNVILVVLILLLLDAIREISKYKTKTANQSNDNGMSYGNTMELVKEFRAQRNFYISGTALLLWFVIKRILALISRSAQLIAESAAAKSQAESATRTAEALLENSSNDEVSKKASDETVDDLKSCLKTKDDAIRILEKELNSVKADLSAMKKQSESVSREYDNLLKEHAKATSKLERLEYSEESKKDN